MKSKRFDSGRGVYFGNPDMLHELWLQDGGGGGGGGGGAGRGGLGFVG